MSYEINIPSGIAVSQDSQDALLRQMMNIERLWPGLMGRFHDVNFVIPTPETIDWPLLKSREGWIPHTYRTQFRYSVDPVTPQVPSNEWRTVGRVEPNPTAAGSLDQWRVDISPLADSAFGPIAVPPNVIDMRFRGAARNALAKRMMEHANAVSGGNPADYFDDMYRRHWGNPSDAARIDPSGMAEDLADDAIEITSPTDREYASKFYEQPEFRNQMRSGGRALNQMKSEGFRGSTNLRSAAGMAGLPLALLGPRLGLPTPVARAAGGALTGGSLFGVPGAIVGGGLGLLASQVDDKSLLGQVLGSMV